MPGAVKEIAQILHCTQKLKIDKLKKFLHIGVENSFLDMTTEGKTEAFAQ